MSIPPATHLPHPPSAPSARRERRRPPTWAKVLAWVGGSVVVLVLVAVLWVAAMLSGGLDDLLGGPGPDADDERVVAARDEAALLDRAVLTAAVDVVSGTLPPGAEVAAAATAACTVGQHNWKIDDGYDLACTVSDAALLQGGTAETFRDDMLALDGRLRAAGWAPQDSRGMTELLDEYWADRRGILDASSDFAYRARMPGPGYAQGDEWLAVSWAQPGADGLGGYEDPGDTRWTTADGRVLDGAATPDLLAPDSYGVVLVVGQEFFRE